MIWPPPLSGNGQDAGNGAPPATDDDLTCFLHQLVELTDRCPHLSDIQFFHSVPCRCASFVYIVAHRLDVVSDLWCSAKHAARIRSRGQYRIFLPGSDEIREAFFHLAELADAEPEEAGDEAPAQRL
jgi:hypothetical protein